MYRHPAPIRTIEWLWDDELAALYTLLQLRHPPTTSATNKLDPSATYASSGPVWPVEISASPCSSSPIPLPGVDIVALEGKEIDEEKEILGILSNLRSTACYGDGTNEEKSSEAPLERLTWSIKPEVRLQREGNVNIPAAVQDYTASSPPVALTIPSIPSPTAANLAAHLISSTPNACSESQPKKRRASSSNGAALDPSTEEGEDVRQPLAKRRRKTKNVEENGKKEKKKKKEEVVVQARLSRSGREIKVPRRLRD